MRILASFLLAIAAIFAVHARSNAAEPSRPLIVAHRGLLRHSPENTLPNFRACLELRLGFEFDVQRTKDGHLVCIHDDKVDRTTNGTGTVSEMTLAAIRELDAGRWYDPGFAGTKVPTVEEVLMLIAEFKQHDILIAVDLKADNVAADVVRLAGKHKVLNRLLFIGTTISDPKVREQLKSASPQARTATVANNADEFRAALEAAHSDWVYVRYLPSKEQVDAVHNVRKRMFIAGTTVAGNLPDNWSHAAQVGIDGILTDYPLELRETFRPQSASK